MQIFAPTLLLALVLTTTTLATVTSADHNILDYGAVAGAAGDDLVAAKANGKAFYDALQAAHNADGGGDRSVLIPGGSTFVYMPHQVVEGLHNVTVRLNGQFNFYEGNMTNWPHATQYNDDEDDHRHGKAFYQDGFTFKGCSLLTLTGDGNGAIHGNGLRWWWEYIFVAQFRRPNTLSTHSCIGLTLEHWHFFNSPRYHVFWSDALDGLIQYCTIQVDVDGQRRLLQAGGRWSTATTEDSHRLEAEEEAMTMSEESAERRLRRKSSPESTFEEYLITDSVLAKKEKETGLDRGDLGVPMFPINTDGFDISGRNVTVRHCHVENFDDALCAKPLNKQSNLSHCTTDLHFEDSTITNGVGASVGSVPPHKGVNCIANSSFKRISFKHPIKAIYVKPNPCPNGAAIDGTGIIDNILYEDIYADTPLLWSIWASTQQQEQPGSHTANTGCSFFYPIGDATCPTQPCVPITNLKLRNVFMQNALLSPGVLRCNESNPCTGWEWNNVTIKTRQDWPVGSDNFLCHAVDGYNFTDVNVGCTPSVSNSSTSEKNEEDRAVANAQRSVVKNTNENKSHHHQQQEESSKIRIGGRKY